MPTQASLNSTSPESIAQGTEITIKVNGVTIGEIYEFDWDEDNKLEAIGTLGSRIIGRRRGQIEGKFTIKGYWLNAALESLVMGGPVSTSGLGSGIYASTDPFFRFDIVVTSALSTSPLLTLKNCVVEKVAVKFSHDKISTEDVNGFYEERFGQ